MAKWRRRPSLDIPPWLLDGRFADEAMLWFEGQDLADPRVFDALCRMLACPVPSDECGG